MGLLRASGSYDGYPPSPDFSPEVNKVLDGTLKDEVYAAWAEEVFVGWPDIEPGGLPPRYDIGQVLPEIPVSPPLRINNMHRPAVSEFFDRFSPTRLRVGFKNLGLSGFPNDI